MRAIRWSMVLILLAVFAAACGNDDGDGDGSAGGLFDDSSASDDGDGAADDGGLFVGDDASDDGGDGAAGRDGGDGAADDGGDGGDGAADDGGLFEDANASDDGGRSAAPDAEAGLADDEGLFEEPRRDDADARFDDNRFEAYGYRRFVDTDDDPVSTFALDVDTGSYTITRRWIDEGALPPPEAVRPEELVNAFDYDYREPVDGLAITVDGGPSPFDEDNVLLRVGVQGEIVAERDRAPAALTFVVDTSGSMDRDDRLGLVRDSLSLLVDQLSRDDTVAIVTYDDDSGVVLHPTPVRDRFEILDAIDRLEPGGSTNLEAGLATGYDLAREALRDDGINRVVLASDGIANVGLTDPDGLARMIRDDADRGIDLVTVGYGMGNFNDTLMEQLADQGDGFYAYVDTMDEAERLFEDELTSTLLTIAKDAKIQVEFDDDVVAAYRLIGFENRAVRDEDFRNDEVDAGELGAGHQVTAVYELELRRGLDPDDRNELGVVHLRWEHPESGDVEEIDAGADLRDLVTDWSDAPDDLRLVTVVTTFAELLRDNPAADGVDFDDLAVEAERLARSMDDPAVDELADLIDRAARMR